MLKTHWKKMALVGLLMAVWLVAASLSPASAPAVALGFTSTPTFTPEAPTATATVQPPTATATVPPPTATHTVAPTVAPTQPPAPQPTAVPPTAVPPTATPVPAAATSVPKTGSGLLWIVAAAALGALLFGARKARTSER